MSASPNSPESPNSFSPHSIKIRKRARAGPGTPNAVQCKVCSKWLYNKYKLFDHSKTHKNVEKSWACPVCEKKFSSRYSVPRHIKASPCFQQGCAHCGVVVTLDKSIYDHIRKRCLRGPRTAVPAPVSAVPMIPFSGSSSSSSSSSSASSSSSSSSSSSVSSSSTRQSHGPLPSLSRSSFKGFAPLPIPSAVPPVPTVSNAVNLPSVPVPPPFTSGPSVTSSPAFCPATPSLTRTPSFNSFDVLPASLPSAVSVPVIHSSSSSFSSATEQKYETIIVPVNLFPRDLSLVKRESELPAIPPPPSIIRETSLPLPFLKRERSVPIAYLVYEDSSTLQTPGHHELVETGVNPQGGIYDDLSESSEPFSFE